ncbi:cyclic pyranopterin monophosphate synthase subunit MoaA [Natranaerovirga hydrolytica]|uniref:GTP 3',8-cyclase n=1 Tax=Natranaerovirga hydrolytica TaxID=680378 RepID=A0A4R1N176_9FIRM|nr:GTP 3',8-cyclase MoaA [Natranaerovirga hydrolytica]TCK97744.1 cyclic pyranopterin monophosphate synthase subunit MoaA [Natranaerovirga hydrolytica]
MKDNYGRTINYLRVSVTNRCNLKCQYCIPKSMTYKENEKALLSLDELYQVIKAYCEIGINKVRITGGEPLVREGIIEWISRVSKLPQIKDLAMTTNGVLLKKYAKDLKEAGLNRLNISLDSLDPDSYKSITGGGQLSSVLEGIQTAQMVGLAEIKINTVLIKDFNDHCITSFVDWTKKEAIDVRFIELMPIGEGIQWSKDRFVSAETVLKKVPELYKIETLDQSSPATYYQLPDGKGKVGLIKPVSCKFCNRCNRMRLTAEGKIKYCLLSEETFDMKKSLRNEKEINGAVKKTILNKPKDHQLESNSYITTNMFNIGG